jgi:diguanylate cyclase (GGDEF)-like protein
VAEGVETQEEVDTLRAMGCDYIQGYYHAKPMPVSEFEMYLREHTAQSGIPAEEQTDFPLPGRNGPDGEKPLVLIVEDLESSREILRELLCRDYRVAAAENGAAASRYIQEHRAEISCILLDLFMPVMDGFQLLEVLRADGTLSEIPVIITTEADSNSELQALHLGADSFVAKPCNPEILLHHVKKAVETKSFWRIKREFERECGPLYQKAYRDELTGLLNRHGLKKAMERLPKDGRSAGIMLDIDNLKSVNDTYGHAAGDEIIRAVGDTLRTVTRRGDIIARVGGDEFVAILQDVDDGRTALEKAQRLCAAIGVTDIRSGPIYVSCSAGITMMRKSENYDAVYRRADQALYEAKHSGKGVCRLCREDDLPAADGISTAGETAKV